LPLGLLMAGEVVGWVLEHGPKDRAMRSVLITIANVARRDGSNAHPGLPAMIRGSGYSRSTVLGVLTRLEREHWVEVTERGGGRGNATVYRVVMEGAAAPSERSDTPDLFEHRNGPVQSEKRSSPDPETVQSSESVPLVATSVATEKLNAWPPPSAPAQDTPLPVRRDDLCDAVVAACAIELREITPSARGALNHALAELRGIGADPAEVPRRAEAYRAKFPGATLTPNALAKHWPTLAAPPPLPTPSRRSVGDDSLTAGARWLERQAVAAR
jgi:hypothetical protein